MSAPSSGIAWTVSSLQHFFRPSPATVGQINDGEESQTRGSKQVESRPQGILRPRVDSSSLSASLTSSVAQIPPRSYYQQPSHGTIALTDTTHRTPRNIREDTAELATWVLSDAVSIRSGSSLQLNSGLSDNLPMKEKKNHLHEPSDNVCSMEGSDHKRPSIISEVSEPVSPDGEAPFPVSPTTSIFSNTTQSCPPVTDDGEGIGSDTEDDDNEGTTGYTVMKISNGIISQPREGSPLLHSKAASSFRKIQDYTHLRDPESLFAPRRMTINRFGTAASSFKQWTLRLHRRIVTSESCNSTKAFHEVIVRPIKYIPSVVLGLLLNVLDALSYGMILFPLGQPIFASLGPDGISMFYVSCIVSQLVYSLGGSIFKGGIGSEMIEVVPFFHKMAFTIMARVGEDNPKSVIATTILSFSLSSVMTGGVFFLMGQCKLGSLIGFFPRHILIGCIGGVGWFLVATGVEVTARLDGNLEYSLDTLKKLLQFHTLLLWMIPLVMAVLLLVIKHWIKHPFLDASYFLAIIVIFYSLVAIVPDLSLDYLRSNGWVFEAPDAHVPFYHFYSLYDFAAVDWTALASTIPAMFALTFFGVLHVPINIPALGFTAGEDNINVDRELCAHGLSNALSGLCGSIQNYLVYTNTVLFMRSGGDSRVAGVLLAVATGGVLVLGPATIGYIPIMVVGTLIFFLGLDLMREALVDTRNRVNRLEYMTILIIVVTMGAYDFVVGILVGVVLACISYVLQTSQISAISATLPGGIAQSTVRRHPIQQRFLQGAGRQIYVMKLAGYLFFGTIVGVEKRIRALLHEDTFESQPIRYLVLDLSKVSGIDFSAAEAFARVNRILKARKVQMVLCGLSPENEVGHSLNNVGLLDGSDGVEFFEDLNSALEYCENHLLKTLYQQRDVLRSPRMTGLAIPAADPRVFASEVMANSPRRSHLQEVATTTLRDQQESFPAKSWHQHPQPLQLILQTFSSVSNRHEDFWKRAASSFARQEFAAGTVLYSRGEAAQGFYLLEVGMLKAEYELPQGTYSEVIVAGTTCGELPFFSGTARTSTTTAERDCVVWMLGQAAWAVLRRERPELGHEMLQISLKLTSERMEAITRHMLLVGV